MIADFGRSNVIHINATGVRLDRFLRDRFGLSHSLICSLSRKKQLIVNDAPVRFNYIVQKNDTFLVNNKITALLKRDTVDSDRGEFSKKKKIIDKSFVSKINKLIIYEDDKILVINKPYGLSVQTGTGIKIAISDILNDLRDHKLYIVHRIDKETRGILVLAKSLAVANDIIQKFKNRTVKKTYLAIVKGSPSKPDDTIVTKIMKHDNQDAFNIMKNVDPNNEIGKLAITKYRVLEYNRKNNTTLIEFQPLTGRKHQIRLHAQYIGCSIIGDLKYGNCKKDDKLQLYATEIEIDGYEKITWNCDLQNDFEKCY